MLCKACDAPVSETATNPHTGEPEDLCNRCLDEVRKMIPFTVPGNTKDTTDESQDTNT